MIPPNRTEWINLRVLFMVREPYGRRRFFGLLPRNWSEQMRCGTIKDVTDAGNMLVKQEAYGLQWFKIEDVRIVEVLPDDMEWREI